MDRAARRKTNLVPPLSRFVGRGEDLARIGAHFSEGARLVTLLGAPGIGKTRLAIRHGETQIAERVVLFCDLTEARAENDVIATVARVLDVRGQDDLAEIAGATIAELGPLLLILDNFDHVATVARGLVERWCAVAPEARFLVTSRTRLAIAGERVLELPALDEASELFFDRARAAGWNDVRAEATTEIAALVRALDGIPLAIELAAARSSVLAPAEMLARMNTERAKESTSSRGALFPVLESAIDSSWKALSHEEQRALAACGFFAGDFDLAAAEAVLDVNSPIDVLSALRAKSLVRSFVDPESGATRFSLFSSIREYAAARASHFPQGSEWLAAITKRYRRFYLDRTRAWIEEHARTGSSSLLAKLAREKEHLEAIQRTLLAKTKLDREEAEDLARVVLHLQPLITTDIFGGGQLAMLDAAIAANPNAELLGRLHFARGLARGVRGDMSGSVSDLDAARARAKDTGDRVLEGSASFHLGARYRVLEKFEEAERVTQRAIDLLDGADHPRLLGQALACMGLLLGEQGRAEEARSFDLRARSVLHGCGDRWSEALALANLAQLDQAIGEFDRAAHGYDRALEAFRESGDRRFEGRYRGYRAGLELERGDLDAARAEFANALEILAVARAAHIEGATRAALGALEAISGSAREAMIELDRAEDILRTTNAPGFVAALDVHRGQLDLLHAREATDPERRAKLLASVEQRIERAKNVRSEDARFAVRLLERSRAHAQKPKLDLRGLDVGPESRWFKVGDGAPVDLGRRGALRLLLDGLVTRRLASPGTTTDWEALLAIGWPGEKVLAGAGATRVRVAVSTLRRLGLAGLLVTREDGYLLDPRAPVNRHNDGFNLV